MEERWYNSPNANPNSELSFYKVGSSKHVPALEPPNATGLFGRSLTRASRILLGDRPDHSFRFKTSFYEDYYRMLGEGYPYDYRSDLDYQDRYHDCLPPRSGRREGNHAFLHKLRQRNLLLLPEFIADLSFFGRGPKLAPEPKERDNIGYIWPSYVIWENDPSYTSFDGSPDYLELPKHVLRQTTGHPRQDQITPLNYRPRIQGRWKI